MYLNLDYIEINEFLKSKLITSGTGVIYTFSKSTPQKELQRSNNRNIFPVPTFTELLSKCEVNFNATNNSFSREDIILLNRTFDIDVNYNP